MTPASAAEAAAIREGSPKASEEGGTTGAALCLKEAGLLRGCNSTLLAASLEPTLDLDLLLRQLADLSRDGDLLEQARCLERLRLREDDLP